MPMTSWEDIYGEKCIECGKLATHFYGNTILCCQCHGGNLVSAEETMYEHKRIRLAVEKKEVEDASKGDH